MAEENMRKRPTMDHKKRKTTIDQHVIENYQLPRPYNKDNTFNCWLVNITVKRVNSYLDSLWNQYTYVYFPLSLPEFRKTS